ncbi:MAG: hypothetical protein HC882_09485, partial [Acidobacteria bacterium]|nr:hypothetical protein [Acidobacteriota bacterium]
LRHLRPGATAWRRSALAGLGLVALSTSLLLALVVGRIHFRGSALLAGGLGGTLLADLLVMLFSEIGSLVLALTLLFIGLVLTARSPLADATGEAIDAIAARLPALGIVWRPLRRAMSAVGEAIGRGVRGIRRPTLASPLPLRLRPRHPGEIGGPSACVRRRRRCRGRER